MRWLAWVWLASSLICPLGRLVPRRGRRLELRCGRRLGTRRGGRGKAAALGSHISGRWQRFRFGHPRVAGYVGVRPSCLRLLPVRHLVIRHPIIRHVGARGLAIRRVIIGWLVGLCLA